MQILILEMAVHKIDIALVEALYLQNRGIIGGSFVQLRREHHMLNRWMGGALDKLHLAYLRAFPASYAGV